MEVGETGKGKLTAAFVHMVNDISSKSLRQKKRKKKKIVWKKGVGGRVERCWWTAGDTWVPV